MADQTQSSSSKDGGKNLQWMYEGAKSMVNREDYLLGKKIDRNFEMFSDVVVHDQEEEKRESFFQHSLLKPSSTSATAPTHSQHKVSALDTRIVRTEDPLVALKFQEEQRRRQLLENPLLKLKAQRVLRKAFEKELKKAKRKGKKKRKHSSSSSSSPSSPKRRRAEEEGRRHHRPREGSKNEREGRSKRRSRSTSRRERQRSSGSTRGRSYDLSRAKTESNRDRSFAGCPTTTPSAGVTQSEVPSKKLTAKDLEERRRAMLANATWRDEMRERNLREAADKLRREQEEMTTNRSAGFMRPMMNNASEDASIEKRLQSNRMNIQRQHDHMDKSFVRK